MIQMDHLIPTPSPAASLPPGWPIALAMVVTGSTGVARADDGDPITSDACTGYDLGMSG